MRGQIIKRAEGRFLVRVAKGRDRLGKRFYHNKTVYGNKRAAQQYLAKVLHEMDRGDFVQPSTESLATYAANWLGPVVAPTVEPKTHDDYEGLFKRYIASSLGHVPLKETDDREAIEGVYASLATKGLSPRTIRYAHSVLHGCLEHAAKRGHLAKNPAKGATLPRPQRKEMHALSPAEASHLLSSARGTRFEALWALLLTGGLRPSEALGLQWDDLDNNRLVIQRTLKRLKDGSWYFGGTKTERARRSVPLPHSQFFFFAVIGLARTNLDFMRARAGRTTGWFSVLAMASHWNGE